MPKSPHDLELEPRYGSAAALAGGCQLLNVALGYALELQSASKEAIRLVRFALSIDDNDPETLAWAGIAIAFLSTDHESAIELVDRAAALNPNSAFVSHFRGWAYKFAGRPEAAISNFERAIRMSPLDPSMYLMLAGTGMALIELRRFDEAVIASKKAQRQNPFYTGAHRSLASALAHLGRAAEAHEAAARLLEVDPAFTISAWIALGAGNQTRNCTLRAFGKQDCPNEPRVSPRPLWRARSPVNLGGG